MKNKSFAIFILTHGRPHNIATLQALQKANCKAKIYFIIDNEDDQAEEYFKTYGKDSVIQFNKTEYAKNIDTADLIQDNRCILFARNYCWDIAEQLGLETKIEDVYKFYEAHKGLDVDYFNIRPMESTCGEYYNNVQTSAERLKILEYLQDIHERDSRVCINYKWYEVRTQFDKCYANFSQIAINENSEVMYCCHKPYEIIGRLDDKDIWEKREHFQTNMQMCDVPCRLTAPNNFIQSLQDVPSDAAFI